MLVHYTNYNKITFLSSNHSEFAYIPILKNAHTFGSHFFNLVDNYHEIENFRDKKYIVFLRDPFKRWYSAVTQWFYSQEVNENFEIDPITLKLIFSAVCLDSHGDLQIKYLNGLSLSRCVFFNTDDDNFEYNLFHFVKHVLNKDLPKDPIQDYNIGTINPVKNNIRTQLKLAIDKNPKYYNNIKHFYMPDLKLLRTVNFYDPRNTN